MDITQEIKELSRKELRYRLYRIRSNNPVDSNDGIKELFEDQEIFDNWDNFSVTWDVDTEGEFPDGHWKIVERDQSLKDRLNLITRR